MTVTLSYYLEDVNAQMAADWTHLRLYRDTDPAGAFGTLVEAEALVADQTDYEFEDSTGSTAHWYRVALYNSGTLALSTKGDPFRPDATTLLDVIAAAAERAGAGFKSTCSSVGTVSQLIDVTLRDQGQSPDYLSNAYVYRPDAAAADQLRRLVARPFDETTGGLTPVREWAAEPDEDEVYYVFLLLPPFKAAGAPYSWADAARDGLQECAFEDTIDIGVGTTTRDSRFDLGVHLGYLREGDIRNVYLRRYDDDGMVIANLNASKQGRYYATEPNGRGQLTLIVRPAPSTEQHVIVETNRRDAELYAAADITNCPLRLAARATVWKAYEYLNTVHLDKYSSELKLAERAFMAEYAGEGVSAAVNL